MLTTIVAILACTPLPSLYCTRESSPVCAEGTTYGNACLAKAAGYHSACASLVSSGGCTAGSSCAPTEFFSELGMCVEKPWSDFAGCGVEKEQGACPDGHDPNPFVGLHCATTCG